MADSSTGGYLPPITATPPYDEALEDIFTAFVSGITGLSGSSVRPRWQPTPPKIPEASVDWCSLGIMDSTADAGPYIQHNGAGQSGTGQDDIQRHEDIEVMCSFYGPNSFRYAAMLRDGAGIEQNIDVLRTHSIAFVECGPIRTLPEFFNQQWIKRGDISVFFRRQIKRSYGILNIVSAEPVITSD